MANSKLPPQNNATLINSVAQFLTSALQSKQSPKLLLALSGGLDSMVLLHLLVACRQDIPFELSAMHVHHGLSPNADTWATFCQSACEKLGVSYQVQYVSVDQSLGLGVEAAARQVRYQALQSVKADWVCLAHHQNDQAETLLLQLARGAGVKGLSSMAAIDEQQGLLRPLLGHNRHALVDYAKTHDVQWVEDESNQSLAFDRNIIRHEVLHVLEKQYPSIISNLSRSAAHQAEASELLIELAKIDAESVLADHLKGQMKLHLTPFKKLNDARAKNLIRYWLHLQNVQMPSTTHLSELLSQLKHAEHDAEIKIKVAAGLFVRTYLDDAYLVSDLPVVGEYQVTWQGEKELLINNRIKLSFIEKVGEGIALEKIKGKSLIISSRTGKESLKSAANRPSKSIKHIFQEANIPPWERDQYPLVYIDDALVSITQIAISNEAQARQNELGLNLKLSQQ